MATAINFKKSIADPIAIDIGNKTIQGRTVSKTLQFSLFTTNENAVWAGNNQLRKEAYPFATISFPMNRNHFRLQVGDAFKLNYAKYGITGMVLRILMIEEDALQSEKITVHCMEDIFSVAKAITEYTDPTDKATQATDYTALPFVEIVIFEAPYVMTKNIEIIPMAERVTANDLGMYVNMSLDGGGSYGQIGQKSNIMPRATLNNEYGLTHPIDDSAAGMLVTFTTTDVQNIETITWSACLAGEDNMAIIGDEIVSFQTITPVSGMIYRLTNIIRGRYGTKQEVHAAAAELWYTNKRVGMVNHSEITRGVIREFKLVPYNKKFAGTVAEASSKSLTITGKAKTPYCPVNFDANGVSFASRYIDDIILTWSARKRGEGAGIGSPGIVIPTTAHEGYFDIDVVVLATTVRTVTDIDVLTWTYTEAMNISDNGALASEVTFNITNWRTEEGGLYTSEIVSVTSKLTA